MSYRNRFDVATHLRKALTEPAMRDMPVEEYVAWVAYLTLLSEEANRGSPG